MFIIEQIKKTLYIIGGIFICLATALIVLNVIIRAIFGGGIPGAYEMTGLCAVLFISFSVPACTLACDHITVTFFIKRFPDTSKRVLAIIARILDAAAGVVLSYATFKLALKMMAQGETTDTLSIPIWPFRYIWLIGTILIVIFAIYRIFKPAAEIDEVEQEIAKAEEAMDLKKEREG